MNKEMFCYAYEGQYRLHFGVDLLEKYACRTTADFVNYISDVKIPSSEISAALKEYQIDICGDVKKSGGNNDMRYFCLKTERDFSGLIDAFGNSRVALLCGHYENTGEYEPTGKDGPLQWVYKPTDEIRWITVVLENYDEEPFTDGDLALIETLLRKLERFVGMKIGICIVAKMELIEFISIDDFLTMVRNIQ